MHQSRHDVRHNTRNTIFEINPFNIKSTAMKLHKQSSGDVLQKSCSGQALQLYLKRDSDAVVFL